MTSVCIVESITSETMVPWAYEGRQGMMSVYTMLSVSSRRHYRVLQRHFLPAFGLHMLDGVNIKAEPLNLHRCRWHFLRNTKKPSQGDALPLIQHQLCSVI